MTDLPTKNLALLDLYCHEDFSTLETQLKHQSVTSPPPVKMRLTEDQRRLQDDVLDLLLRKQEETYSVSRLCFGFLQDNLPLSEARRQAVDWVLGVTSYHSFSALTAFFSVNYLDQFLVGLLLQRSTLKIGEQGYVKPWMVQLAAVACLSLAAKMEETHVPLLLDLQLVGESRYAFEPRSVQRMELLVLLMLDWRMNPVTPFSFLKDISRMIDRCREMEFVKLFGICIASRVLANPVKHRASVIAAAVAVHVSNKINHGDEQRLKYELHKILQFSREEFDECHHYLHNIHD